MGKWGIYVIYLPIYIYTMSWSNPDMGILHRNISWDIMGYSIFFQHNMMRWVGVLGMGL